MRYLLDTHTLIWALEFPHLLSSTARSIIAKEENALLVSAISAFELATKVRLGKLPEGERLHAAFETSLGDAGVDTISVDNAIALRAGRLVAPHRDPFDRLVAATALAFDLPLLSIDSALDVFGVRRTW